MLASAVRCELCTSSSHFPRLQPRHARSPLLTFASPHRLSVCETNGGAPPHAPSGDGLSASREREARCKPGGFNVRSPVRDRSAGPDGAYPKQHSSGSADDGGQTAAACDEVLASEAGAPENARSDRALRGCQPYPAPIPDILKTTGMITKSCTASKMPCAMMPGIRFFVR
jgi:hypothetical protein